MTFIRRLDSSQADFDVRLTELLAFENAQDPAVDAAVTAILADVPEIVEAFTVAGAADAMLRVVAGDVPHLERVISRLRGLPYVQQTDTTMLLSVLVRRPTVPQTPP